MKAMVMTDDHSGIHSLIRCIEVHFAAEVWPCVHSCIVTA